MLKGKGSCGVGPSQRSPITGFGCTKGSAGFEELPLVNVMLGVLQVSARVLLVIAVVGGYKFCNIGTTVKLLQRLLLSNTVKV